MLTDFEDAFRRDHLDVVPAVTVYFLDIRIVDVLVEKAKPSHVAIEPVDQMLHVKASKMQMVFVDENGDQSSDRIGCQFIGDDGRQAVGMLAADIGASLLQDHLIAVLRDRFFITSIVGDRPKGLAHDASLPV